MNVADLYALFGESCLERGQLLAAANNGDGTAVDRLIDARLENEPASEEQIFAESSFCYWTRDGPYTKTSRTGAAAHDTQKSSAVPMMRIQCWWTFILSRRPTCLACWA
jgi:hypothetical protein